MMTELYKGKCDFVVFDDVSKKTGNHYQALKVKIGEYEISSWILLNAEKMYCIENEIKKAQHRVG